MEWRQTPTGTDFFKLLCLTMRAVCIHLLMFPVWCCSYKLQTWSLIQNVDFVHLQPRIWCGHTRYGSQESRPSMIKSKVNPKPCDSPHTHSLCRSSMQCFILQLTLQHAQWRWCHLNWPCFYLITKRSKNVLSGSTSWLHWPKHSHTNLLNEMRSETTDCHRNLRTRSFLELSVKILLAL